MRDIVWQRGQFNSLYHVIGLNLIDEFLKAGSGSIAVGAKKVTPQSTNADKENELLPEGWTVVVMDTEFKLVRK